MLSRYENVKVETISVREKKYVGVRVGTLDDKKLDLRRYSFFPCYDLSPGVRLDRELDGGARG